MSVYSDSPEIEEIVLDLREKYLEAHKAFDTDRSFKNMVARDEATAAFNNARSAAYRRTTVPVIGGDTVKDGVN